MRFTEKEYLDLTSRQKLFTEIGKANGLQPKASKYRNRPVTVNGIRFDSKKEAARYHQLKLMEQAGIISNLTLQPSFDIAPGTTIAGKKKPPLRYVADFQYTEGGVVVVEDVKGCLTEVYKLKRHLMKTVMGIEIREI